MSINGTLVEIDPGRGTVPITENNRTMLPIRAIVENMGGTVDWDENNPNLISIRKNATLLQLSVGSRDVVLNGNVIKGALNTAHKIENDRTMLPIRYIAEVLNAEVNWNPELPNKIEIIYYTMTT